MKLTNEYTNYLLRRKNTKLFSKQMFDNCSDINYAMANISSRCSADLRASRIKLAENLDKFTKLNSEEQQNQKKLIPDVINDAVSEIFPKAMEFKEILDKKYGKDKYLFVSIGRSPVFFARFLENMGTPVRYLPISGLTGGKLAAPVELDSKYLRYLKENLDLNSDFLQNSGKKAVFADYTFSGNTIREMVKIVRKQLGLARENTAFISINKALENYSNNNDKQDLKDFINFYQYFSLGKRFAHFPKLKAPADDFREILFKHTPSSMSRLYNLAVMLKLKEEGLLAQKSNFV